LSRIPHVIRRRNRLYLRVRIPADVAMLVGKDYHVRTLRTGDPRRARLEAARALAQAHAAWNEVRRIMSARVLGKAIHELADDDILRIRNEDIEALSDADKAALIQQMELIVERERLAAENAEAGRAKKSFEVQSIAIEVNAMERTMREAKLIEMQGKAAVEHAQQSLRLAQVEQAMREAVTRIGSVPAGLAQAELPPEASLPWNDASLLERFCADNPAGESSADERDRAFREFADLIGGKAVKDVAKVDIKAYADYLRDKIGKRGNPLKHATIVKSLGYVKAYFKWHAASGHINVNPGDGVNPRAKTAAEKGQQRRAFTTDELRLLFDSPLFTGCKSPLRLSKPGPNVYRNERYWFWMLLLLTGARLDEIAAAPARIVKVGEVECLDFLHSTKTPNAPRLIPILSDLRRVGIHDWIEAQQRRGRGLVQGPDAVVDWSKWLNRYLNDLGLDDPKLVAYSLRHNFRQQLRASGIHSELVDKVFGHDGETVGANYGRDLSPDEARLVVERVRPPVPIEHLWQA
jgi:Site-specific recombinase XerD